MAPHSISVDEELDQAAQEVMVSMLALLGGSIFAFSKTYLLSFLHVLPGKNESRE